MKTKSFHHEATFKKETSIEVIKVAEDLYAFRTLSMWSHSGAEGMPCPPDTDMQGFANEENIVKAARGEPFERMGRVHVLSPELAKMWKDFGVNQPHSQSDTFQRLINESRDNVFEKLKADLCGTADIVFVDWSNNEMNRLDGSYVAKAIFFSDMNGGFSSLKYDLNKVFEHLSQRDDIVFAYHRYGSYRFDTEVTKATECIGRVSTYDEHDVSRNEIIFRWIPTDEDYATIRTSGSMGFGASDRAAHAIFEQDFFGLRAAGAALFDDYYKEVEGSAYDNDM